MSSRFGGSGGIDIYRATRRKQQRERVEDHGSDHAERGAKNPNN